MELKLTDLNQDQMKTLKSALSAFRGGNIPMCKDICTGLLRQVPDEPGALRLLGQAQYFEGDFESAIQSIEKSLKAKPEQYSMWVKLGNIYAEINQLEKAEDALSKALEYSEDKHLAYFWRAQVRMSLGKTKKAWEDLSAAVNDNPLFGQAYRLMHLLEHPDSKTEKWAESLEEKINLKRLERVDMIQAHYALAGYYEAKEDTEQMWRHLDTANGLQKNQSVKWQASYSSTIQRIREDFAPELLKKKLDKKNKIITPVFIVGLPRSGSTLLESMLSGHPDIFAAGEVNYMMTILNRIQRELTLLDYPSGLETISQEDMEGLSSFYQNSIKRMAGDESFSTDKLLSNSYLVGLIYLLMPWAKIIHIQRDPMDTAFSIYKNFFWEQNSPEFCSLPDIADYKRLSDEVMAYWNSILPGFILDVSYEDLVNEPEIALKKVTDFIGVPFDKALTEKKAKGARTLSAAQVQKPLYKSSIGLSKKFEDRMVPFVEAFKKTSA